MSDYAQGWQTYRRIRNLFIVVVFSIILFSVVFEGLSKLGGNRTTLDQIGRWGILVWIVATMIVAYRMQYFLCPRCGKRFSSRWWYHRGMAFARKCAHCGLAKYANNDAAPS